MGSKVEKKKVIGLSLLLLWKAVSAQPSLDTHLKENPQQQSIKNESSYNGVFESDSEYLNDGPKLEQFIDMKEAEINEIKESMKKEEEEKKLTQKTNNSHKEASPIESGVFHYAKEEPVIEQKNIVEPLKEQSGTSYNLRNRKSKSWVQPSGKQHTRRNRRSKK